MFEVQTMLEKRTVPQGATEYLIYWEAWPKCWTWENTDALQKGGASEILVELNNRGNPMTAPAKEKKKASE